MGWTSEGRRQARTDIRVRRICHRCRLPSTTNGFHDHLPKASRDFARRVVQRAALVVRSREAVVVRGYRVVLALDGRCPANATHCSITGAERRGEDISFIRAAIRRLAVDGI